MELEGVVGSPYKHPEVRKKLPAPFARPSINLDGGIHRKRSWKDTPVTDLKPGDVVANLGRIATVEEHVEIPEIGPVQHDESTMDGFWIFRITNVLGKHFDLPGYQRYYAFTEDPNG